MARTSVVGEITRGTTNPNRLRRCDRWVIGTQAWRLRAVPEPVAVDLGYGAHPVTAVEMAARLGVVPGLHVVGLEIDPARVAAALPLAHDRLSFARGGFETPLPSGRTAALIRAFNVLRQYDEEQVAGAWELMCARLDPAGIVIDGTCDELGRRACWVALDRSGPRSLTVSVRLGSLDQPSDVAERLPKALIHRNVPGERVHAFLTAWDEAWTRQAPLASYGKRQRFVAAAEQLRRAGWPVLDGPHRWRLGELTVAWDAVRPAR